VRRTSAVVEGRAVWLITPISEPPGVAAALLGVHTLSVAVASVEASVAHWTGAVRALPSRIAAADVGSNAIALSQAAVHAEAGV